MSKSAGKVQLDFCLDCGCGLLVFLAYLLVELVKESFLNSLTPELPESRHEVALGKTLHMKEALIEEITA